MALYNLRSADGDWRITKFDNDLNPMQSYLVSTDACECPAGVRPSCRHRQMLPKMLAVQAEDSGMFYDFEHDQFLASELPSTSSDDDTANIDWDKIAKERLEQIPVEPRSGLPATSPTNITATEVDERIANYKGPLPGDSIVEALVDQTYDLAMKHRDHPTGITIRRRL